MSLAGITLFTLAIGGAFGQVKRFEQDRFAIGFWVDPPADEKMDQRYTDIAQADFTLVLGGFGAKQKDTIVKQIALCKKYDLKLLVGMEGAEPGKLLDAQGVLGGYVMSDEPSAKDFGQLRAAVDKLREKSPGKLAYINLFPSYATCEQMGDDRQMGADSYEHYVSRFVNEVDPDVLSMDHYPMMKPGDDRRKAYCNNLAVMRKYSLEKKIPFWNFFNAMPCGPHY